MRFFSGQILFLSLLSFFRLLPVTFSAGRQRLLKSFSGTFTRSQCSLGLPMPSLRGVTFEPTSSLTDSLRNGKNIIEMLTVLVFILPFFSFIFYHSLAFVAHSYAVSEASNSPGGLSCRWLIKGVIPLACCMINLAAISKLFRTIGKMRRRKDVS